MRKKYDLNSTISMFLLLQIFSNHLKPHITYYILNYIIYFSFFKYT